MASPLFKDAALKLKAKKKDKPVTHQCVASLHAAQNMYGRHDFKVAWDCLDGWHLLDLKKKVASYKGGPSTGLKKCPFCECELQIVNKVEIT
jgi:hypothetical protein